MSFLRDLATGSDNCTPDGAGPSNAVGALVNTLLGSSSKTQEQLREVRAGKQQQQQEQVCAPFTGRRGDSPTRLTVSRCHMRSCCSQGHTPPSPACTSYVLLCSGSSGPPPPHGLTHPPPSLAAAPCAAGRHAWGALGLHVSGGGGSSGGCPCGLLPGARGCRTLTHGESWAGPLPCPALPRRRTKSSRPDGGSRSSCRLFPGAGCRRPLTRGESWPPSPSLPLTCTVFPPAIPPLSP